MLYLIAAEAILGLSLLAVAAILPATRSHPMARFIGYTTYEVEDAVVLSEAEYQKKGIDEDWAEYVWIIAEDKAEAYARYDDCIQTYYEDNEAGRPIPEAY